MHMCNFGFKYAIRLSKTIRYNYTYHTTLSCVVIIIQTTVISDMSQVLVSTNSSFYMWQFSLKFIIVMGRYRGWAFVPKAPVGSNMGQVDHFCGKVVLFQWYHIFYNDNSCISSIWVCLVMNQFQRVVKIWIWILRVNVLIMLPYHPGLVSVKWTFNSVNRCFFPTFC